MTAEVFQCRGDVILILISDQNKAKTYRGSPAYCLFESNTSFFS